MSIVLLSNTFPKTVKCFSEHNFSKVKYRVQLYHVLPPKWCVKYRSSSIRYLIGSWENCGGKSCTFIESRFLKSLFMLSKCHSVSIESSHSKGQITKYSYVSSRNLSYHIFYVDIHFLIVSKISFYVLLVATKLDTFWKFFFSKSCAPKKRLKKWIKCKYRGFAFIGICLYVLVRVTKCVILFTVTNCSSIENTFSILRISEL